MSIKEKIVQDLDGMSIGEMTRLSNAMDLQKMWGNINYHKTKMVVDIKPKSVYTMERGLIFVGMLTLTSIAVNKISIKLKKHDDTREA